MKILMVCIGNICRSPMAEGIMKKKALEKGLDWQIDSAATTNYHIGQPPHHLSQKICKLHNIDISAQRARLFLKEDVEEYDYIYAMATDVLEDIKDIVGGHYAAKNIGLLLEDLQPYERQDVPDPYYGTKSNYQFAFDLISKGCDAIVEKYC